jgi:hypothetical protein
LTRDAFLDLRGRMSLDTIRPGAPTLFTGVPSVVVTNRPVILGFGFAPGITYLFNRLEVTGRWTYDRVDYENGRLSDGSTLELGRTSYNAYGGLGRLAYDLTPDVKPFFEGAFNWRVHDSPVDFNGFYRDSGGFSIRGGSAFVLQRLLRGEISGGYAERNYQDPRLVKLHGPVIDAALIYTPSALTTITLRGSTTLNETTVINASGVFTRTISGQVSHDLMRNLNIMLLGSCFVNNYQGSDVIEKGGAGGAKIDYRITRFLSVRGSYMHEQLKSAFPNASYSANVFLMSLRLNL